ncbi:hypothetical protein OROHE_009265 [Orobanche hederae]
MEEIVACEGNRFVSDGTQVNNDLLDDIVEEAEGMDDDDDGIHMVHETAPSIEFTKIDRINDAVVDSLLFM